MNLMTALAIVALVGALAVLAPDSGRIEGRLHMGVEPISGNATRRPLEGPPAVLPNAVVSVIIPAATATPEADVTGLPADARCGGNNTVPWAAYDGLVDMPLCFERPELYRVITCESQGEVTAVGGAGELGRLQIHPIHRAAMAAVGLSFDREADRTRFAIILWERANRSMADWACSDARTGR